MDEYGMVHRHTEELLRAAEQARLAGEVGRADRPVARAVRRVLRLAGVLGSGRARAPAAGRPAAVGFGGTVRAARKVG